MKKINFKKIKNSSSDFFVSAKFTIARGFMPFFKKALFAVIIFSLASLLLTYLFKPDYITRSYNYISKHFFRVLNLDDYDFKEINIVGNKRVLDEEILQIINDTKNIFLEHRGQLSYQTLVENLIDEIKQRLPWVKKVTIWRNMPDILNIVVEEYEPFAMWHSNGKYYISDKDGNLVPISQKEIREFEYLVILSGRGAYSNAKSLFDIFVFDPKISTNVYSATWVGNRRWDIRFDSGILIKMPENDIIGAWKKIIKIYDMPGSTVSLKVIDLRIADKVYLEYDNSLVKELRKI